jgi:hypothetical protein
MRMETRQPHLDARAADAAGRALAAWLAPYIAAELGRARPPTPVSERDAYVEATCAEFVQALGDKVLRNATTFFTAIQERGQIGSLELAERLGVGSPRNIPAVLTTPLKRRARAMGLPYPWGESADHTNRTVWLSIEGVPERMLSALNAEIKRRNGEGSR